MIPIASYRDQAVGVLGLGRSGLATARSLRAGGSVPICWDDGAAARDAAVAEGFRIADLSAPPADLPFALYAISPGIPHLYPAPHPAVAYALARAIPLDNDIGLYLATRRSGKVIAVTGTNGKSTTAALIHHILAHAGRPAALAGNIGRSALDLDPPVEGEIAVLELSSYQTELARDLGVDVAVLTNLSPDHLDRHGGIGGYFAAKARLLRSAAYRVIGVDEVEGRFLANQAGLGVRADMTGAIAVSSGTASAAFPKGVSVEAGRLIDRRDGVVVGEVSLAAAPALKGAHNAQNAACALGACEAVGLSHDEIQAGLNSFPGLPHRMQTIAEAHGVAYVNDSKATNADAAEKALRTFERIRWIVGGRAKEGGIEALRLLFPKVAAAYLVGEATEAFEATLASAGVATRRCGEIAAAVSAAQAEAQPGDTVLLAPAAASFDQFPDFEKRGEAFAAAVKTALGQIDDE